MHSTTPIASGLANQQPLLTIAYPNTCTLSKPLVAQLALAKMGSSRVHVVVPALRGGSWYLDTNPKPGAGARFPARGKARFRIQQVPKMHFLQTRPLMNAGPGLPFKGFANIYATRIFFRLGAEVPGYPGYYALEPATGPVPHSLAVVPQVAAPAG